MRDGPALKITQQGSAENLLFGSFPLPYSFLVSLAGFWGSIRNHEKVGCNPRFATKALPSRRVSLASHSSLRVSMGAFVHNEGAV